MNRTCALTLICGVALFAAPPREIAGQVVDEVTGAPIAHARVTVTLLQPGSEPVPVLLLTDDRGSFELKNAPEGAYQVACERSGYLPGNSSAPSHASSPDTKPAPILVRLVPQGVIEGSVVDEKGVAVPFANVQVYRQGVVEGHRVPQLVAGKLADDTGAFRIFGLSAGRYRVGVTAPASTSQRPKLAYRPVFYPNSLAINGGEVVDLTPGQERQLKFRLPQPVPAREIRGRVAPAGAGVNVRMRDDDFSNGSINVQWDSDAKSFRISGLLPGAYILEAKANSGNQHLVAVMPLIVADRDIEGVLLEPRPVATLTGILKMEWKEKPAGPDPRIELRSRHGRFTVQTEADGNLKFYGLPEDTYRVVVSSNGPVYLRSAWQGSRDVLQEGLTVLAGSAPEPIEVVLSAPGAIVEGTVTMPDSGGPTNILVALLRRAGSEMILEKEQLVNGSLPAGAVMSINSLPTIHGGQRFTIKGVAPGDYYLFAWPSDSSVPYADPDFFERYGSLGKAISISGTEKTTVNLESLAPRIE